MSFAGFFWKVGELLCGWVIPIAAPLGMMIIGAKAVQDGKPVLTMPGIIFAAALVGIIIMGLCGVLPGLLVKERFQKKTKAQKKVKVLDGFKGAFSSRPFNILIAIVFLNTLAGLLASGIDQFLLVYYMNAGDKVAGLAQKALLTTGYAFVGFAFIPDGENNAPRPGHVSEVGGLEQEASLVGISTKPPMPEGFVRPAGHELRHREQGHRRIRESIFLCHLFTLAHELGVELAGC